MFAEIILSIWFKSLTGRSDWISPCLLLIYLIDDTSKCSYLNLVSCRGQFVYPRRKFAWYKSCTDSSESNWAGEGVLHSSLCICHAPFSIFQFWYTSNIVFEFRWSTFSSQSYTSKLGVNSQKISELFMRKKTWCGCCSRCGGGGRCKNCRRWSFKN